MWSDGNTMAAMAGDYLIDPKHNVGRVFGKLAGTNLQEGPCDGRHQVGRPRQSCVHSTTALLRRHHFALNTDNMKMTVDFCEARLMARCGLAAVIAAMTSSN